VLEWISQPSFIAELNELLEPLPIVVQADDPYMPASKEEPKEARLETFGPKVIHDAGTWTSLKAWWLAHAGNTPNWDFASACVLEGKRGLLLVEAKANVPELSKAGKRLVGIRAGKGKAAIPPSSKAKQNDARIREAIAEAGRAFAALGVGKAFTAEAHYQLANRLAFAWKLASLGVPVALVYLGFCGDHGLVRIGAPLACEEHWCDLLRGHFSSCVPMKERELRVVVDGVPLWFAMRARDVLSQSPPVAV
jgi:hypothetical protein